MFEIRKDDFYLDNQPIKIYSGAIIYGSYFSRLENAVANLKYKWNQCDTCNSSCDGGCNECQSCDSSCNGCNSECGEYCCDSHSYWIDDIQGYVCEHCYDNYYGKCAHCEERFHNDDLTDIGCETYCESCRDELFIQCDNCEHYEPNDEVFYCEGCGRHFCSDCEEEQDGLCSECYEEREEEENDEC